MNLDELETRLQALEQQSVDLRDKLVSIEVCFERVVLEQRDLLDRLDKLGVFK